MVTPGDVLETIGLAAFFLALIIAAIIAAYNVGFNDGDTEGSQRAYEECDEGR